MIRSCRKVPRLSALPAAHQSVDPQNQRCRRHRQGSDDHGFRSFLFGQFFFLGLSGCLLPLRKFHHHLALQGVQELSRRLEPVLRLHRQSF